MYLLQGDFQFLRFLLAKALNRLPSLLELAALLFDVRGVLDRNLNTIEISFYDTQSKVHISSDT